MSSWSQYLQFKLDIFAENYNSHFAARRFIDDANSLLARVNTELGDLIAKKVRFKL